MKRVNTQVNQHLKSALTLLLAAMLLTGCSTSRMARRHDRQPDIATQRLGETAYAGQEKAKPVIEHMGRDSRTSPLVAALTDILADPVLGFSQAGVSIIDLTEGQTLYTYQAEQRMRPASTQKMVTAIAALDRLGPSYNFSTSLLTTAPLDADGTLRGDIYLRGGMDPLLTAADVRNLATKLRQAGVRQVRGRIIADASLKDSDQLGWGWCWDDENPTLSPLLVGGKPALATALQNALRGAGVKVTQATVGNGTAPASARELAAIRRPLTEVLHPMLKESDNLCAESVFYQLGNTRTRAAEAIEATLANASSTAPQPQNVVYAAVSQQPVTPSPTPRITIADGSGLSLYNYHTAASFTRLLAYAATRPDSILNPLLQALPIAATDGTLRRRMANTPAAANVRAKTGSVTAVSSLVGYTTQRSTGHLIAFAIINNGVETMAQGRNFQDRICILISE